MLSRDRLLDVGIGLLGACALCAAALVQATPLSTTAGGLSTVDSGLLGGPDVNFKGLQYTLASTQAPAALLMRFDLSAYTGWHVDSAAVLTLSVNSIWSRNFLMPALAVYSLNQAYDVDTVTMNTYGGHAPGLLATATPVLFNISGQSVNFILADSLLQDWIDRPHANYGLFIEETSFMDMRGHSDIDWGNGVVGAAPRLVFEASPVPAPEPVSFALVGVAIGAMALVRRRRRGLQNAA